MMERIKQLATRIDALSLRERLMVFALGVAVVVAGCDWLLFQPVLKRQASMSRELARNQEDLRKVDAQIQSLLKGSNDSGAAARARLAVIQGEIQELDRFILEQKHNLVPPEQVVALLREILLRNRSLELVSLGNLAPVALIPAGKGAPGGAQLWRHGVEVKVRGRYLDLLAYLAELETLPAQLYWGRAALLVETHPDAVLTLTVHTLSLDEKWLKV